VLQKDNESIDGAEKMKRQGRRNTSKTNKVSPGICGRALAMFDNAPQLIALTDKGGALSYLNPAGRALLCLSDDVDICGIPLVDCLAANVRAQFAKVAIPTALNSGVWCGHCVLSARDGRRIDVTLQVSAHQDSKGRFDGLALQAQDLDSSGCTRSSLSTERSELLRLSAHHLTIQEDERRRIAVDLHDGLGQSLGLMSASIERAVKLLGQDEKAQGLECLNRLKHSVHGALDELRRISMNLRPAMLDSLGILATLSWHSREIETAYPEVRFERRIDLREEDVPVGLRTPIFRIVQEAGNNAIKHGKANRITVQLTKKYGVLELAVEDNGKGFDPDTNGGSRPIDRGLGLHSMRERAELSCGIFDLTSERGKGTLLRVRWAVSLREIGLDCATEMGPWAQACQDDGRSSLKETRDFELAQRVSACTGCIRKAKSND
jgi:signal transduction histidine kinase